MEKQRESHETARWRYHASVTRRQVRPSVQPPFGFRPASSCEDADCRRGADPLREPEAQAGLFLESFICQRVYELPGEAAHVSCSSVAWSVLHLLFFDS